MKVFPKSREFVLNTMWTSAASPWNFVRILFSPGKSKEESLLSLVADGSTRKRVNHRLQRKVSQLLAEWAVLWISYIYHIVTALRAQHEDVLGTSLNTLFLSVFVEIWPQGDSMYREIGQMCSGHPLRSPEFLYQSPSDDAEELCSVLACPGWVSSGHPMRLLSLLILWSPCCWQANMPGGMWAEEESPEEQVKWQPTAGGDTGKETQPAGSVIWQTSKKWTPWKSSSAPSPNPQTHQSWNILYCSDLKNQAWAFQIK